MNPPSFPVYNAIGKEYNSSRSADPYIADRMYQLLQPIAGGVYLDIGCGTGNYLAALTGKGVNLYCIDPSEAMLSQARNRTPGAVFIQSPAEELPVDDAFFDGAIAMFTIHHWTDKLRGLQEVQRVLKPGARLVFFTFTPEQMKGYWLNKYFPEMMRRSWELVPDFAGMTVLLAQAGLQLVDSENYTIQEDLTDHFLYSSKHKPEQYLSEAIRRNASSFRLFCSPEELANGLHALEEDVADGKIEQVMDRYANDGGDYIFLVAQKI